MFGGGKSAAKDGVGDDAPVVRSTSGVQAGAAERVRSHSFTEGGGVDEAELLMLTKEELVEKIRMAEVARDAAVVRCSSGLPKLHCTTPVTPPPRLK